MIDVRYITRIWTAWLLQCIRPFRNELNQSPSDSHQARRIIRPSGLAIYCLDGRLLFIPPGAHLEVYCQRRPGHCSAACSMVF